MTAIDRISQTYRDVAALKAATSLMGWDQQVLMPEGGASARAVHVGILKRQIHEALTSDEFRRDIELAQQSATPEETSLLAALRREVDVLVKLPIAIVERKAKASSAAYDAWRVAKPENDFARMAPYYEELFDIARESAEAIGYTDHIYDPLISLFEHGATYADARSMFDTIKPRIVALVRSIVSGGRPIDDDVLTKGFTAEDLLAFTRAASAKIGFDYQHGRIDLARNAFCTTLSGLDVRMTTRPSEHFKGVVSSSFHEMGHALYEQKGLASDIGTPLAGGTSLAVHESQSRLWENIIGRSQPFWQGMLPLLAQHVPALAGQSAANMSAMMSKVEPEFIRVGADELTYNLHILVRFELEVEILTGVVRIADLPEAWNEKYRSYLGILPPTNTLGCLQDVHWSRGSVGYFPTYAMGNLIGAQIWEVLTREIPNTHALMAEGHFGPILEWLTERIYKVGQRLAPRDLVIAITGEPMKAVTWLRYAEAKYRGLYLEG